MVYAGNFVEVFTNSFNQDMFADWSEERYKQFVSQCYYIYEEARKYEQDLDYL